MRNLSELADRGRGVSLGPRGVDFVRGCMALAASADARDAVAYASNRWGGSSRAVSIAKAVAAAATTDNPLTAPLVSEGGTREFFGSVAELSIIGRMAGLRRVPLQLKVITALDAATAYWTGEGQAKPITPLAFSSDTLAALKVLGIAIATEELLNSSDPAAEGVFRRELLTAVVRALDTAFIDPANTGIPDAMPASITAGLTPVSGTASFAADLKGMLAVFSGDLSSSYLVMPPDLAVGLAGADYPRVGARGGEAAGLPVLTSRYCPAGVVALVDAAGVAFGEASPELRSVRHGDVMMSTTPAMSVAEHGSPSAPLAAELVSLWATNAVAIVVGRHVNWQAVRPGSVAVITEATYGDAA